MKTQTQMIKESRIQLDKAWNKKYPNGSFCIQIWNDYRGLHWNKRRRTSHTTYKGLTVESKIPYHYDGIYVSKFQNNAFGKCYYEKTLDDLIDHARDLKINEELIIRFIGEFKKCV